MIWFAKIFHCRRTTTALAGIICLTILGIYNHSTEVATSIAAVCIGLAGANAGEKAMAAKNKPKENP